MCYEGGCAVMTNEVPDIVVDLPTYEQVESIKTTMATTGGKLAGVDGKMYKAKMVEGLNFADGIGPSLLDKVWADLISRFYKIASSIGYNDFVNRVKMHIRDDIYMIFYDSTYIVYDVRLGVVINAYSIAGANFYSAYHNKYFEDSKYIYVKGYYSVGSDQGLSFAVLDKNTFKHITSIIQVSSDPINFKADWLTEPSGDIGFVDGSFFYSPQSTNLWWYEINFDVSGIPTSFKYKNNKSYSTLIRAVLVDNGYIYVIHVPSNTTVDKCSYLKASNSLIVVGTANAGSYTPNMTATLIRKYSYNGGRYAIVSFGRGNGSMLNVYSLETLLPYTNITKNYQYEPLISPDVTHLYVQPYLAGGTIAQGMYWDTLSRLEKKGNVWVNMHINVPMEVSISKSSPNNLETYSRIVNASPQYGVILDDELYCKFGVSNELNHLKVTPIRLIQGYLEV